MNFAYITFLFLISVCTPAVANAADTLTIQRGKATTTYEGVLVSHDRAHTIDRYDFSSWNNYTGTARPWWAQ